VTIVGLIENEWPERPRRNIFYPPALLKTLGWPSEKDRRAAADARFVDLIASARLRVELSTFTLEDESLVTRALQLDEVARARLSTVTRSELPCEPRSFIGDWAELRTSRSPAADPAFHGSVGPQSSRPWSVSALETYLGCPFKFYAQHVLKLAEEPDDEEVMDPRRQGQFVHEVFEAFFTAWAGAGHREITPANLDRAREMFVTVVDRALAGLSEGEAGLERTRLLGSSAAAGLGDAVFRMEAERPVKVVERLLEHKFEGAFTIHVDDRPRVVHLRGKADRVDLLADGTFRLIDYKLGWPPDRNRALQLPIYALLAEDRLAGYRGRNWTVGEAMYLAFKGPKRVVPLFTSDDNRSDMLAKAQQRVAETLDSIAEGAFPPSPDDVYRCESCSFAAVCRKDYVGDV
jgi:RecB family exonuclease